MVHGDDLNYIVLNFDLDTKKLKECYPKSRRNAYREIQQFLESNGFEHRQWSGYVSTARMDMQDVYHLLRTLGLTHPWLKHCIRRFDAAGVRNVEELDVSKHMSDETFKEIQKNRAPRLDLDGVSGSLMDQFNKASAVADRSNAEIAIKTKEEIGRE